MINEVQKMLDNYLIWIKDKTILKKIEDCVEITTPYLDRHNDHLQIYVKKVQNGFILTDDGYIINDLKISGCELDSKKRKELLSITLNGFGIKLDGDSLIVNASTDNFAVKKHNLMQAMLAVNDLFYLASPIISGLFLEDVSIWLSSSDIRYTPRVKFTGKSGYDYLFDFVIPASKNSPERILQTINNPSKETAINFAFAWAMDTKASRPVNSQAYVFLNDIEHSPSQLIIDALKNYEIHPILWSKKEEVKQELIA